MANVFMVVIVLRGVGVSHLHFIRRINLMKRGGFISFYKTEERNVGLTSPLNVTGCCLLIFYLAR